MGPRWVSNRQSGRNAKEKHEDFFHDRGETFYVWMIRLDEKNRRVIEEFSASFVSRYSPGRAFHKAELKGNKGMDE
jgi:hypothetical protein